MLATLKKMGTPLIPFLGASLCFSFKGIVNPFVASDVWILAGVLAPLLVLGLQRMHLSVSRPGVFLAFSVVGSLGVALSFCVPMGSDALQVVGLCMTNVAYVVLLIAWTERYARLDISSMVIVVAGTYIVGSLLYFAISFVPTSLVPGIVVCLPLFSALLFAMSGQAARYHVRDGRARNIANESKSFLPGRLLILMAAYSLVYGAISNYGSAASNILSAGFVGLLLLLVLAIWGQRASLHAAFRLLLPLMMVGLAALQFCDNRDFFVNCALSTCYGLAEVVAICMLCDIAHRFQQSATELNAWMRLVIGSAFFMGKVLDGMLHVGDAAFGVVQIGASLLAVAASMAWLTENYDLKDAKPCMGAATETTLNAGEDSREKPQADLVKTFVKTRCEGLSRDYHLTTRESEVLLLLGFGLTAGLIEKELTLSESTVKTHIRHIYSKLGIHSRDELKYLLRVDGSEF